METDASSIGVLPVGVAAAIVAGETIDRPAMRALVEGLGNTAAPAVCPHGSPLPMHVGADVLERQFGWS